MDKQVVDVDLASIPSEVGSPAVWPNSVTWSQNAARDGWFKIFNGVQLIVTNQELKAWEMSKRGLGGADLIRGVKLRDRLDGVIASRNPGANSETSPARVAAEADATGTP